MDITISSIHIHKKYQYWNLEDYQRKPFHRGAIEHEHHLCETECCKVFEIAHKQLDLKDYYMNLFCLTYHDS